MQDNERMGRMINGEFHALTDEEYAELGIDVNEDGPKRYMVDDGSVNYRFLLNSVGVPACVDRIHATAPSDQLEELRQCIETLLIKWADANEREES